MNNKVQIISDKNSKSLNIKKKIIKNFKNYPMNKPNVVIVIGGDGFMLQTLKKIKNLKNYFTVLTLVIMDF